LTEIAIGSAPGNALDSLLIATDLLPGHGPSYQLCKTVFTNHPLGAKIAEAPISMAQSQEREIVVQDAPEDVVEEFKKEWMAQESDDLIHNTMTLSRVYGLASIIAGCENMPSTVPLDMEKIWEQDIFFNVLDPLNTSGSLVLNQIPTSPDFMKPQQVRVMGQEYHCSRAVVMMNGHPIYIDYTNSAFGFVGRSVYQSIVYPLRSFILSMIADDVIVTKNTVIVAAQEQPSSVIDAVMERIAGIKRVLLKIARAGQILSIGKDEKITTLDMTNVDSSGKFARDNILKNIATGADMPAKLLDNETLVEGFGEGTEDAKNIARYIERIRRKMNRLYYWMDTIIQYRAWNPAFYQRMQTKHPELYKSRDFHEVRSEWRSKFSAVWPSLLIEPESERVQVEKVKLEAIVAFVQTLLPKMDPVNAVKLMDWAAKNVGENKLLFAHELSIDWEDLEGFLEENQERQNEAQDSANAEKFGKFDSARIDAALSRMNHAASRLPRREVARRLDRELRAVS
jgi:Protein of unknown function (DUF1073)